MGTLIIPEGFSQIIIPFVHSAFARPAEVTFGISHPSNPDATVLNEILNEFDDNFGASIDDSVTMGPAEALVGTASGENLSVVGTTTEEGSNATTGQLNQGQALLVHKRTGRGGRRGRGRMYIPWILGESGVSDTGSVLSGTLTALQANATQFLLDLIALAGVSNMVLLHSPSGDDVQNPTDPGAPDVVLSLSVDNIVGSQRRRLGR